MWMLTPSMRELSGKWIRDALQLNMKCPSAAIADKAKGESSEGGGSSSGAPSSNQLVSISVSQLLGAGKAKQPAAAKKDSKGGAVNVMRFFSARYK